MKNSFFESSMVFCLRAKEEKHSYRENEAKKLNKIFHDRQGHKKYIEDGGKK